MSDKGATPEAVRRFTTEYVPAEDRIRISLERADESLAVLWLTRRLAVRLIPQILKVIDTLPRLQGAGKLPQPSDNAQRRSQLDALGSIEQQAPVLAGELPNDIETHLVSGLGIRMNRSMMLVDFRVDTDTVVQTLPFPEESIRQWLGVLYAAFKRGGWKEDVWPAWITAKGWNEGPDALRLN